MRACSSIIVTTKYLKKCSLWIGSKESFEYNAHGLRYATVERKYAELGRKENRSSAEEEYFKALEQTLALYRS